VGFNHHSNDGGLSISQLLTDVIQNDGLVVRILGGITIYHFLVLSQLKAEKLTTAINHDARMSFGSGLRPGSSCSVDEFIFIIWAFAGPSKDDVDVLIATSLDNCSQTLICHTHKGMRLGGRAHRINGDRYGAIRTIFEA
jgi:hypothetical protein